MAITKKMLASLNLLLIILLLTACAKPKQTITLTFFVAVKNTPIICGETFSLSHHDRDFSLLDARFYLSDIRLVNDKGQEIALALQQTNNPWQHENIALIDLSHHKKPCENNKTINTTVTGQVPMDNYTGVTFTIGIPFALNHNEPAFMQSPLNIGSMFWSWQMGYKFLAIDLLDNENQSWFFHLGSTNCQSPSAVKAPSHCERPNRITIQLNKFDFLNSHIQLNLDKLLEHTKLLPSSKCMSHIASNNDCLALFNNLLLDPETGACIHNCQQQTIFTHEI